MDDNSWENYTKEINDFIDNSCLSIYGTTHEDQATHSGSCCLVSYKNFYFLVTAQHLIDEHKNKPLYVQYRNDLIQVGGNFCGTKNAILKRDTIDVDLSFIEINNFSIFKKTDFIILHDYFQSEDNIKTLCGYPNSRNKPNKLTETLKRELYIYTGLSTDHNLSIHIEHNQRKIINNSGNRVNATKLRGISGGCIIGFKKIQNSFWFKVEGIILEIDSSSSVISRKISTLKKVIDKYLISNYRECAVIIKITY